MNDPIKIDIYETEAAVLVGVKLPNVERWEAEDYLDELEQLVTTAGADVVDKIIQEKDRIDAKYFVGRGKVDEIKRRVNVKKANMVVFDDDLNPAQIRNLEKILNIKILDRSAIILDIFAKHAKTKEAKTQVELAQLHYTLPRLTRLWTHLSKQKGGGISLRGPGETQLETDKRLIQKRISHLKKEMTTIEKQRQTRSKGRSNEFRVSLIGYTNVGKSTIMNALTHANVLSENKLFATLDSTVRKIFLNKDHQVLIADTVGFIRKLPHQLVASFKSTMSEISDSDLLLHIVDVGAPHFMKQIKTVNTVLKELGAEDKKQLMIFNKVDTVDQIQVINDVKNMYPDALFVSALKGIRLQSIKDELLAYIESTFVEKTFELTYKESKLINQLYALGTVIDEQYEDEHIYVQCKISKENENKFNKYREEHAYMF
jgi:GTP-binding protein HflX